MFVFDLLCNFRKYVYINTEHGKHNFQSPVVTIGRLRDKLFLYLM